MIDHATARTVLDRLRSAPPLVGCITNSVVTNFTANVLLALGAAPAMVDIIGEAGPFAATADGQLINVGTPTPEQRGASMDAAVAARRAGTPIEYLSLALAVGARRLAGEDGWDEARALAHVDAHLFPGGGPARDLFGLQFDSLAHGLDWEGQQALIDASPLRGTVA